MNSERQPIKQAVKTFYTSKPLSDIQQQSLQDIQQRLQQPQDNTHSIKPVGLQWLGSIAASLLLFIVVLAYAHTPAVITAAYADVILDADLNNGMQSPMNQWLSENHIDGVPQKYPVEMSKFCTLGLYKTTHFRIAGTEQGMMHLFFHQGKRPIHWLNRTGTVEEMNWKLIKVRGDLTVIVLFTNDMRENTVQQVLSEMLPGLQS